MMERGRDYSDATVRVECTVNGEPWSVDAPVGASLAEQLNNNGVTTNVGCGEGSCGTCLVRVDDRLARSCLTLAVQTEDAEITTVHGLNAGAGSELTDIQRAISAEGGLQCGFCTPAFVLLLQELADSPPRSRAALRERLSSVTCRCTGYSGLVRAAERVLESGHAGDHIRRHEDERFLTGRGSYIGTRNAPDQLWARFVRSPYPHAAITRVQRDDALAMDGVEAVLIADDLPQSARSFASAAAVEADLDARFSECTLARDTVRYVGQPIVAVIARSRLVADEAAEAVQVEYEVREADEPVRTRTLQHVGTTVGTYPGTYVRSGEFYIGRHTAMPMECRGMLAVPKADGLTLHGLTKQVRSNRDRIAALVGLEPDRIEVASVDTGGAFGVKGELYPEDVVVPWAALHLGKAVKWIEERAEHVLAANHSREQSWEVSVVADERGQLQGATAELTVDVGAYHRPLTDLMPKFSSALFPGPYRLPNFVATGHNRYSHKTPTGPYRAPGRFEVNFVRERALDMLAADIGITSTELRLRNLVGLGDLPHEPGTDAEGGLCLRDEDFHTLFAEARAIMDKIPKVSPVRSVRRGVACLPFLDKAGVGVEESASVQLERDGRVIVTVASSSSGQGHETTLAKIAADELGVHPDWVSVHDGSVESGVDGLGTFASRTALMTGNAVAAAAVSLSDKIRSAVASTSGVDVESVRLSGGSVQANTTEVAIPELATSLLEDDMAATATFHFDGHTYPYGAIVLVVDVDVETFVARVGNIDFVCDVGAVLDPTVVRGQIIGGAVQGLGGALMEELPYNAHDEPLVRDLNDYPLPLAADVPEIGVTVVDRPTKSNPLGVRGVGEAATAIMGAAVGCAISDALPEINDEITRLPLTPSALHAAWVRAGSPSLSTTTAERDEHVWMGE